MKWFEVIAGQLDHLIWPVVLVVVILLFRTELAKLIGHVKAINAKAAGAEINVLMDAADKANRALEDEDPIDANDVVDVSIPLSGSSPLVTVEESYLAVLDELRTRSSEYSAERQISMPSSPSAAAQVLELEGQIPASVSAAIGILDSMRDAILNQPQTALNDDLTQKFRALTESVIVRLRKR